MDIKQDIIGIRQDIASVRQDIKDLTIRLEARIDLRYARLKSGLIRWTFGIVLTVSTAQAAVILSVTKFFH